MNLIGWGFFLRLIGVLFLVIGIAYEVGCIAGWLGLDVGRIAPLYIVVGVLVIDRGRGML